MPREPARWTQEQMIELAARGLGKVNALGPRGATLCSIDEIVAMAAMLALLELEPIAPGEPAPVPMQRFFLGPDGEFEAFLTKGPQT
jgi:hypothetical protein